MRVKVQRVAEVAVAEPHVERLEAQPLHPRVRPQVSEQPRQRPQRRLPRVQGEVDIAPQRQQPHKVGDAHVRLRRPLDPIGVHFERAGDGLHRHSSSSAPASPLRYAASHVSVGGQPRAPPASSVGSAASSSSSTDESVPPAVVSTPSSDVTRATGAAGSRASSSPRCSGAPGTFRARPRRRPPPLPPCVPLDRVGARRRARVGRALPQRRHLEAALLQRQRVRQPRPPLHRVDLCQPSQRLELLLDAAGRQVGVREVHPRAAVRRIELRRELVHLELLGPARQHVAEVEVREPERRVERERRVVRAPRARLVAGAAQHGPKQPVRFGVVRLERHRRRQVRRRGAHELVLRVRLASARYAAADCGSRSTAARCDATAASTRARSSGDCERETRPRRDGRARRGVNTRCEAAQGGAARRGAADSDAREVTASSRLSSACENTGAVGKAASRLCVLAAGARVEKQRPNSLTGFKNLSQAQATSDLLALESLGRTRFACTPPPPQ